MIKQLKGAGLGWRDSESSIAAEKLGSIIFNVMSVSSVYNYSGEIPLRDLVYRVLQLPDSLKALVYDFGKLSSETEKEYVHQIVHSRLVKVTYSVYIVKTTLD